MARHSPGSQVHRAVLVERYLGAITPPRLAQLAHDTQIAVAQVAADGVSVSYLGSAPVPEDETSFCLSVADSIWAVEQVNRRLLVPSVRITVALIVDPLTPFTTKTGTR